eukprot:TRINITY_DN48382_c0_g1_i1.p2 TRINITY_DN48382_c0_g1~~TRINITY_DN48382_c0_g1_i1.p2  ORF type:complete len:129 (+),score=22.84 TRINITY_DN48382_c0_g1_i1:86-472(+)
MAQPPQYGPLLRVLFTEPPSQRALSVVVPQRVSGSASGTPRCDHDAAFGSALLTPGMATARSESPSRLGTTVYHDAVLSSPTQEDTVIPRLCDDDDDSDEATGPPAAPLLRAVRAGPSTDAFTLSFAR